MQKDILAAFLILALFLTFSAPVLFAEDTRNTVEMASYVKQQQESNGGLVSDLIELNKKNRLFLRTAGAAKYGVDLLKASDRYGAKSLSLRAGFDRLSKNAAPSLNLVVTW